MIHMKEIQKIYNKNQNNSLTAIQDVSLCIHAGEMTAIMGKSGAGKSTLLHIMACMDDFDGGEYFLDGKQIRGMSERQLARLRNEKIGIVLQDYALIESYTGIENVMLPLDFSKGRTKAEREDMAWEALERVGMEDLADQAACDMSGGEKQRIAIARAIANDPPLILADEPTGALDSRTSEKIMTLFETLHQCGKTIVLVTHDPAIAGLCERTITIHDGRVL